jgi:Flp pilus assembly secretin CpaC
MARALDIAFLIAFGAGGANAAAQATEVEPSIAAAAPTAAASIISAPQSTTAATLSATWTQGIGLRKNDKPQELSNGYAEHLKATVSKPVNARAAKSYAPIKSPEDKYSTLEVDMFVGESRVFPAPNIGRIAVGNGSIMSAAALDEKEVIVFANSAGTSSLFVWNKDGRYQRIKINIVAGDTTRVQREVAAFLSQIPNAKASVVGDKVIVEGDNLSDNDRFRIAEIAKTYPQVVNFTDPTGWEKMIMMDVKVVEFPKSVLREIGLKWGNPEGAVQAGALWYPGQRGGGYTLEVPNGKWKSSTGGPTVLPRGLVSAFGMNLVLNAQLNLLAQNGDAAILAEPILSTRNGSSASFLAGGEIPYQGASSTGTPFIQFKEYGVRLDIKPIADKTGSIRADIKTKVSSVDGSISTVSGPALRSRETNTTFNVKNGETIVLSGFLSREQSEDVDKIPGLGDLPILGALFRSKKFVNKETELVIFVTPTIVSEQSPGLRDRVEKTHERLEQAFGQQPYLTAPVQPATDTSKPNGTVPPATGLKSSPSGAAPVAELPSFTTNTTASTAMARYRVRTDGVPLRLSPDVNSQLLVNLSEDTVVERLPQPSHADWTPVQVGKTRGWILTHWIELLRE